MTVWERFEHDPRRADVAGLRAGEEDRELARGLLVEAYARGRLDAGELEERAAVLHGALTLGELRDLCADLEPAGPAPAAGSGVPVPLVERERRRERDLLVLLLAGGLSVLLWALLGRGYFWPVWVLVYTGIPVLLDAREVVRAAVRGGRSA